MRHASLSETESNPWLPDVALGEVRDALEGTVEEWLTRAFADPADLVMPAELVRFLSDKGAYHSIDRLNDNEVYHGADFLRAAVELVDDVSTIAVSGIVSTLGLDSAALFWLWQRTEFLHRKALAVVIVNMAKQWYPYVQMPHESNAILTLGLKALDEAISDVARTVMTSIMEYSPAFECAEPTVPHSDDVVADCNDAAMMRGAAQVEIPQDEHSRG